MHEVNQDTERNNITPRRNFQKDIKVLRFTIIPPVATANHKK